MLLGGREASDWWPCGEQTGGLHSLGLKAMLFKRTDSRLHADPLLLIEGSDLAMDMRERVQDIFLQPLKQIKHVHFYSN